MFFSTNNEMLEATIVRKLRTSQMNGWQEFTFQFIHPSDSTLSTVYINRIDEFKIERNFAANYTDNITLSLKLVPEEFLKVVRAYDGLRCAISFQDADFPYGGTILESPPRQYEYRVLIENPADLLKKFSSREFLKPEEDPDSDTYNSMAIPLSMQLISDVVYEKRHISINSNLLEVTPEEMIYFVANTFNCTSVKVIPPDNQNKYEQIPIPPMLELSNALNFIQERYGAYNKGMGFYFSGETLFVFPAFENEPEQSNTLAPGVFNFYKIATNAYEGADCYVAEEGSDYHCMVNRPVTITDISESSMENIGNAQMVTRSTTAYDVYRKVDEDKIMMNEDRTITVVGSEINAADTSMQNAKYTEPQDNVHQEMSRMAAGNCAIANVQLLGLDPYLITPNHPCVYHFEDQQTYKTLKGVIVGVISSFEYVGRPVDHVYNFNTALVLRLVPDKKSVETE